MKIKVKVIANSTENKVLFDEEQNLYKVKVTAQPEKGKANKQVIELLADCFKLNTKSVHLALGTTAKIKIFEIDNEKR